MTYILINNDTDSFIGIDRASGGYPYDTDNLCTAKIWHNKQAAKDYADKFPNKKVSLHELIVNDKPCAWD